MFWIVMLIIAGLAGFAFDWITFQKTPERVTMSFETRKFAPVVEKLKQAVGRMRTGGRDSFEHSRHS